MRRSCDVRARRARSWLGAPVALVVAASCGTTPPDGAQSDELAFFESEVVPVIEASCGSAACHAARDEDFASIDATYFAFPTDDAGRIVGRERVMAAHQRAMNAISPDGGRFAEIVRKPLDESLGGLAHRGGTQFDAMNDPDLATLTKWADMVAPREHEPLAPLVQAFAERVQPVLQKKGCMFSNCHGAGASNSLVLDPGVLGEFDHEATLRNYPLVVFHMNFDTPEAMMSRLVRKTIPIEQGGIFHRGGNTFFNPEAGDPDLAAIVDFMGEARARLGVEDAGVERGIVFVASDPTPRELWDLAAWQPGGDIYSLVPATPDGTLTNLTRAHHTGPADIRDPTVSYDAQRIAFAMRKTESDCLNLYVMNVDGTGLVQLTHDTGTLPNGIKISNVDPLWGPDDRIYFASTRAGVLADGGRFPLSNLWRVNADGTGLVQLTHSADMEIAPAWRPYHHQGKVVEQHTLDLMLTAVRGVGDRRQGTIMRVPPDFRADYHPHYGTQHPVYQVFTAISRFQDDRDAVILMDEANVWEGGALGLIDRNLGPAIVDGGEPAVVQYVDSLLPLALAGEEIRHRGTSPDGYYRDPQAMPDGTIIVSRARGAIDHRDRAATPDTALHRLTLHERWGNIVRIDREEVLVDVPGKIETDPTPIMVRRREEILEPSEHLTPGQDFGEVLNFDLAVELEVAREVSPSNGGKLFDDIAERIHYVRIVEQIPPTPEDYPGWPDTSQSRIGRGSHGMRRILAEVPVASDHSYYIQLPAVVPYYVQALDLDRMSSATHNLWVFLQPGEKLRNVTRREVFDHRCGGCHGARSGETAHTVATPDVLTQASLVAANYDARTERDLTPTPHGIDPAERIEVDFERDVQPILDARCATSGCHGGAREPNLSRRAGVEGFSGSYEALTARGTASRNGFEYVDPESANARTSYLTEVITGRELGAPRDYDSGGCPAPDRLPLGEAETLFRWMDLGASYLGIGPRTRPELPEL